MYLNGFSVNYRLLELDIFILLLELISTKEIVLMTTEDSFCGLSKVTGTGVRCWRLLSTLQYRHHKENSTTLYCMEADTCTNQHGLRPLYASEKMFCCCCCCCILDELTL